MSWHANGQKEIECTYVHDNLEGKYEKWYTNGQKILEPALTPDRP